nr:GAF and ANTAR domain-containing protein [Pseudactinotalea sp. HY160]
MSGRGDEAVLATSGPVGAALGELQFTAGQGPSYDAFETHRPALAPDLAAELFRWPGYATAAADAGVGSVFAFPLGLGAAGLGVLTVFARPAGPLSDERLSLALGCADLATELLLANPEGILTDPSAAEPGPPLGYRSHVYQAQGMVMVQLGTTLVDALARMRAHAFATDRSVTEVAEQIIGGRLVLDPTDP